MPVIPFFLRSGYRYHPGHYSSMLRGTSSQTIPVMATAVVRDASNNPITKGFINRWPWNSFEPTQDNYVMATHDCKAKLDWCQANGYQMVIMIEHRTFGYVNPPGNVPNPDYLASKTGLVPMTGDMEADGWTIAIWDPYVVTRLKALLTAFAAEFASHPALEGVMIEETSLGIPAADLETAPAGKNWVSYTPELYRDALIEIIAHWATLAPNVYWWFYLNYMAQGTPPVTNAFNGTYLNQVALSANCVITGPDAQENDSGLQNRAFWIYTDNNDVRPVAAFASTRVYNTGATGADIYDFCINTLGANYMCWAFYASPTHVNWTSKAVPQMIAHPTFPAMQENWT